MAKFYGKNSGYLAKKDYKYYFWACGMLLLPLGFIWLSYKLLPSEWTFGIAIFLILFVVVISEPLLDFFLRKSGQYHRGRGGESDIKKELGKLSDDYSVFQDVIIGQGKGNLDFVVLGPAGIVVLEVKSHKGEIGYNGLDLTLNGEPFRDKNFFKQVHGQTWALKNYIKQETGKDVHINSVLLFSSPYARVPFGYNPISNIYIISRKSLLGLFAHLAQTARSLEYEKLKQAMLKTVTL